MRSNAATVADYLRSLPVERARVVRAVRKKLRAHIDAGFQERMNWGMISYEVPLARYPKTYNNQPLSFVALASQKNYCSLYLMCMYQHSPVLDAVKQAFADAGLKLDMGKSCIRFREIEDLPLDAIGEIIGRISPDDFIDVYETVRTRGTCD